MKFAKPRHEGALTEIGSESYSYLSGSGIDPGGRVVGTYVRPGDSFGRAFLWDGKLIDLGFLPGGEFTQDNPLIGPTNIAYGLNTDGQVVGASTTSGQLTHAFLWSNGTMSDLGALAGQNRSTALSINDSGQIVGYSAQAEGIIVSNPQAVLWDRFVIYDVNSLIAPDSGWQLQQAISINNRGEIAALAQRNGQSRPVLLVPMRQPATAIRRSHRL